jgi:hypothetical protein
MNFEREMAKSFFDALFELVTARKELDKYDGYYSRTCDAEKINECRARLDRAQNKAQQIIDNFKKCDEIRDK